MSAARVVAIALVVAGCGSNTLNANIGFSEPSGVALFRGVTTKDAGVGPYFAIANGGRDDVTLVDARDREPVLAPVVVKAQAIPTPGRPGRIVAASLHDDGADLLLVVPAGTAALVGIRTWEVPNQVEPTLEVDLSTDAPGSQILAAIATPILGAGGVAETGRARLVLALTDRRLVTVDYARLPDGGIEVAGSEVQDTPFQAVNLAVSPDGRWLFAATPDDLPAGSGRFGVVEIDPSAGPGAWTFDMLPTRAPTAHVAAGVVAERVWEENDPEIPESAPYVLRVYAALDPVACGTGEAIECGIVTVDPSAGVRGIVADPLGEMPYHPPARIPSGVAAIAMAIPPSIPTAGIPAGRLIVETGLGARETTGVVAVAAQNGRVYLFDAGRRTLLNETDMLVKGSTTDTTVRASSWAPVWSRPKENQLAFPFACDKTAPSSACVLVENDTTSARENVTVTPGYTYDETFTFQYQGVMLDAARATTGDLAGRTVVALQEYTGTGFTSVVRLYDPALGIHVGDRIVIDTTNSLAACEVADDDPTTALDDREWDPYEAEIEALLAPDAVLWPGGAVVLVDDGSACQAALRAGTERLFARVRAGGWILRGASTGYAGRPVVTSEPGDPDVRVTVDFRYADEDALAAACPLSPWPEPPVTCEGACRDACEELALARKARRIYTLADSCGSDEVCTRTWGPPLEFDDEGRVTVFGDPFPNKTGPVIAFAFSVRKFDSEEGKWVAPSAEEGIHRDVGAAITLESGQVPTGRAPTQVARTYPTSLVSYDQTLFQDAPGNYRFAVSYLGDMVLDFTPNEVSNRAITIR